LADEKRRRREEVAALEAALAAAHGELLALRRQLAVGQPRSAA
jgi:ribosomal protein L29